MRTNISEVASALPVSRAFEDMFATGGLYSLADTIVMY
jgi:hypothetical protein